MIKSREWCCDNPDCQMLNIAEPVQIGETVNKDKKSMFVCGNCGFVKKFVKIGTGQRKDIQQCIPFEGREKRLPKGYNPDGTFVDYQGKSLNKCEFMDEHRVDPERYLKWRDAGKPKPANE